MKEDDLRDHERIFAIIEGKLATAPYSVHKSRHVYVTRIRKTLLPAVPNFCLSSDDIFVLTVPVSKMSEGAPVSKSKNAREPRRELWWIATAWMGMGG